MEWSAFTVYLGLLITSIMGGTAAEVSTLCGDNESIISLDASLTPRNMIYGSGQYRGHELVNILNFGVAGNSHEIITWCTSNLQDMKPFVIIQFSSSVYITGMISSGNRIDTGTFTVSFESHHVTNFTLEMEGNNGTFVHYSTETESPKFLEAPEPNTLIRFEEPIATQRIRLRPFDWYNSDQSDFICQGVAIFGCLQTEAISESTQPPLSTQSTITTEELVNQLSTGLSATEPMESAQTFAIVVNDYQSLAIGLPLALLTIFVVVIIVSVGAGLCFILRKRHTKEKVHYHHNRSILTSTSSTVELLEESEKEQFSRGGTIRVAENALYGEPDCIRKEEEVEDNTSADAAYEPVTPIRERNDSMVDNMLYSSVTVVDNPQYSGLIENTEEEGAEEENNIQMEINNSYHSLDITSDDDDHPIQASHNLYEEM